MVIPVLLLAFVPTAFFTLLLYINKGNSFVKGKAVLLFSLLFLLINSLSLLLFIFNHETALLTNYLFSELICLASGAAFYFFYLRKYEANFTSQEASRWVYLSMILITSSLIAGVTLSFTAGYPVSSLVAISTYTLPFALPALIHNAFNAFMLIPTPVFQPWFFPVNYEDPDFERIDFNKVYVLEFEMSKTPSGTSPSNFKAKAPIELTFGDLFIQFVSDYNYRFPDSPIIVENAEGTNYAWIFYKKPGFFEEKKLLDPLVAIQYLGIKESWTIVCKRMEIY